MRTHATGQTGTRMRLITDPDITDHTRWPHTDVICIEDTPDPFHSLRVHPVTDPSRLAVVLITHLTLTNRDEGQLPTSAHTGELRAIEGGE